MNLKSLVPVVALMALAGCTSAGGGGMAGASPSASTKMEDRSAFAGSWSGQLASGKPISVRIPETGMPSYRFDGQNVPVRSARMSGNSLVLTVGAGGGTVTLTPAGNSLDLAYRFRGDSANATLSRS